MPNNVFHNVRTNSLPPVSNSTDRLAFLPPSDGFTVIQLDNDHIYTWNATTQTWIDQSTGGGGTPVTTIGTIDGNGASANGASISGANLFMQSASVTVPGEVNNTTQSFSGNKTFTGTITASNLSGTNTGDVTLTAVGTSPSANAASLSGQALTLQPFDGTHPGVVTASGGGSTNFARADGTWAAPAGTAGITALTGQVTASGPGSAAATVVSVGGSTAANIHNAELLANAATAVNTASALMARDGSGQVAATTFTGALTGHASLDLALSGGTMSGAISMGSNLINSVTDPVSGQDAATKSYVDAAVSALNPADAVYAASTISIAGSYFNGVAGIGATFTTTATGVFTVDGVTPPLLSRVLIKNQASGFQNGIYNLTTAGALGISAIFTRALDYNTASDMNVAGLIPVQNGTLNALSAWQQIAVITTVGVDALVFSQFTANPSLYLLKANNLSDVSSKSASFDNLSPMTTGGDLIYGGASGTGTRLANGTVNQILTSAGTTVAPTWQTNFSGIAAGNTTYSANNHGVVLSSATNAMTVIAPNASVAFALISGGTGADPTWAKVPIAGGGTNVTTVTIAPAATAFAGWDANKNMSAANFLAAYTTTATAAGTTTLLVGANEQQYFTGVTTQNCKLPVATTLVNGLSYNITNLSSGIVTVQTSGLNTIQAMAANTNLIVTCINTAGGTGTASWSWVYNNVAAALPFLNPMTTGGDLIYGGASGVGTRLANGSAGQFLKSNGTTTAPSWAASTVTNGVTNQTTTYNILTTDYLITCDATSAGFTVTLPTAVGISGQVFVIKKTDGTVNLITLATTSSQTVDGYASTVVLLGSKRDYVIVQSDGANWQITDWGISVAVSYYASASGTVSTTQTVNFDTKLFDPLGLVTASAPGSGTWKFTAKYDGLYQIFANVYTLGAANNILVYKNGTAFANMHSFESSGMGAGPYLMKLTATDFIDVRCNASQSFGGAVITANGVSNIQIMMLGN